MTEVVVCVDVGSTYTKAAAVDAATGARCGTASHPTTLGTDVMDGLNLAVRAAVPDGAPVAETLVCSSAGGGLRLGVIGNEPLVTARAAYRAGLSAGAKVVHVCAGDDPDWDGLAAARPDVLLLAGGTDGGDETALRAHAAELAASPVRAPVVLAGNAAAADLAAGLREAGFPVTVVDNVLPRIGRLNPVPARTALREAFLRHVIAGKHLSAHAGFTALVKAATPDAVLTGIEILADLAGEDLLAVDVGGATTDVYSVLTPDAELSGPRAEVAGTAWRSGTVEGDLGVRHTATGIVEAAEADGLDPDPHLHEAARHRADQPGFTAETDADRSDDAALSALAARVAVGRHARGERIGGPTEPLRGGKDLAAVRLVIGSGGVLRRDPAGAATWLREAVCHHTAGGFRPPRDAEVVIDADYALAPAGLLAAAGHREVAERLLLTAFGRIPNEP